MEHTLDVGLTKGVVIEGKVTESGSGEPVAGAAVGFFPRGAGGGRSVPTVTKSDGSFQLLTKSGPGHVIVGGPNDDYVLQRVDDRVLRDDAVLALGIYVQGLKAVDAEANGSNAKVDVVVTKSQTVKGRVIGVDGQPVENAWILSSIITNNDLLRRGFGYEHERL